MGSRLLALLLLAGCDPTIAEPGRNGVQVRFDLPDAEVEEEGEFEDDELWDGKVGMVRLTVQIHQVLFEGDGPDGAISTSNDKVSVVDVVTGAGAADVAVVDLVQGVYEPASVSLSVAPDASPSVHLEGWYEETAIDLVVEDALTLDAAAERFVLPDGPDPTVWFGLYPEDWFDEVDIPYLPPDQVLRIAPDENRALYDAIVPRIAVTTVGSFPEASDD